MDIGKVKIIPRTQGACRVCGVVHSPILPHDRDSLYYQNWFYRKHKRFPTWEDAMSHCSPQIQKKTKEKLRIAEKGENNGRINQHHSRRP